MILTINPRTFQIVPSTLINKISKGKDIKKFLTQNKKHFIKNLKLKNYKKKHGNLQSIFAALQKKR